MSQENHQHYQKTAAITAASTSTSTSTQQQQQQQQQQQPSENSNNNNTTYRPRSPDLSAFILPPQQLQQQQQPVFHPSYQDSSSSWQHQRQGSSGPALTGLPAGSGSYPPVTHRGSYDASPYFSPQGSFSLGQGQSQIPGQTGYLIGGTGAGGQQQGQVQRRETVGYGTASASAAVGEYSRLTQSPTATAGGERVGPGHSQTLQQQSFWQTPASGFTAPTHEQPVGSVPSSLLQLTQQPPQQPQHNMPPSRRKRGQTDDNDDSGDVDYAPESSSVGGAGGKSSRKRKSDNDQAWTSGRAPGEVGPSLGIDIKTKFPVARIKRIMQADEDVGKVAQATPTAVSKALELFMIALVTKAAAEARDRSSKRVTAAHLKQAVIKDQTFDFLQEIIEKVPDPTEKKGGGSGRAASEDVDDGGGGPAKRKRAARGKKKVDSDED
ncbi:hypothetical protein EPUS_08627 [Endocarpon pusillum Z07020]|uniref:NCT transcriptional regulatory complex subunit A n=1 Tax=Endocarpon pusillum (strain Z07020 / HMAS-L-300199) TaxID=1263415 RepID=U1GTF3_ENDPU|nr:uncharacterized protein EPUS_08627 [Endocarpon pusillum Z07020]ERF75673.1 hypothetical protein EPUS_08627 [Endocarpon pusillum Z07020]